MTKTKEKLIKITVPYREKQALGIAIITVLSLYVRHEFREKESIYVIVPYDRTEQLLQAFFLLGQHYESGEYNISVEFL